MNYYYITVQVLDNAYIFNTYKHLWEVEAIYDKLCNAMTPPQIFSLEEFLHVLETLECRELDTPLPIAYQKSTSNGFTEISLYDKSLSKIK
ncbi:hypothetical protein N9E20_03155 [Crocinitomicaceae bacterium]|nr:hypothetical protein [Crocinitomicaceae bacterium]